MDETELTTDETKTERRAHREDDSCKTLRLKISGVPSGSRAISRSSSRYEMMMSLENVLNVRSGKEKSPIAAASKLSLSRTALLASRSVTIATSTSANPTLMLVCARTRGDSD